MRMASVVTAIAAMTMVAAPAWAETLRIAGNFNSEHSSSVAIQQFKAEVEEASGGDLIIEVFPDMALGGAGENVSQTRAGTIAMTWVGMAYLSRTVPELEAVSLPFLFPSRQIAYEVIDGEVGDLLAEKLADKGFTLLGMMELGQRQVTNNVRPLLKVEDLQGLKIRTQPIESHLATFAALGANATPMDIKEVYSAMQQGVIDGHENPYNLIYASRFFEVQKYLSNTGHFFDFIAVVANKDVFEALSPEQQAIIRTAMDNAVAAQRLAAEAADTEALAKLQELGMQYDELPPEELAKIRELTAGVVDEIRERAGKELVDQVIAAVEAAQGS
ncbi:MAG: TRAP transporter substrate-binding protein [Geminicoccaceae bacterium]